MYKVRVLPVNVKLFIKVHLIKTHLTSQSPSFFDHAKTWHRIHFKWCSSITQTALVAIPPEKKRQPGYVTCYRHFVRKSCHRRFRVAILPQFLNDRTPYRAKGFPDTWKSQFYIRFWRSNLISCKRDAADTSKSRFYISFCRSNLICAKTLKEGKRRRCEDVKI